MIRLKKLGHIQLRVADLERSKAFYWDVVGFHVAEQDPKHGDLFMTLGEAFHTLDMAQHENPETAKGGEGRIQLARIE
jgi:catechol-2,3-dioxygenase